MIFRILLISVVAIILAGCSGTTVVLVPDAKGKIGQVDVKTDAGTTRLTKAYESTEAAKIDQAPSEAIQLDEVKVKEMFAETLAKEPSAPTHFLFHFATGSTEILAEEKPSLAQVKASIDERKSCDISVIGHSDTVGENNTNKGISMGRAESVAKALVEAGVSQACLQDLRFYGESDLTVPTADDVDEPLNRRVEVEIR